MKGTINPVLDYMEAEITEFCNLNCKGCADFSNLAREKKYYLPEEYKRDLTRLSELFSSVKKIRLLGGEPFLNPELTQYIEITKSIFPDTDLRIVTNGLMIDKIPEKALISISSHNCIIDISNYPPTRKKLPVIKEVLEKFNIKYDVGFPMNLFFRTILEKPNGNPQRAFSNCIFSHCHMMGHGKISPCSYAHCIGRLNNEFGLSYPESDSVDLYSEVTGEEIIGIFSHPHEFCNYCSSGMIPYIWHSGYTRGKAKAEDWIIKDSFMNSIVIPQIHTLIKVPAITLRDRIQKKK